MELVNGSQIAVSLAGLVLLARMSIQVGRLLERMDSHDERIRALENRSDHIRRRPHPAGG